MNMRPDVVLINPGNQHEIYQSLAASLTAIEPPTWLRMIAGWLIDHGYKVRVIDQNAVGSPQQAAAQAMAMMPQLVVIVVAGHQPSASTQSMSAARALAKEITLPKIMVGHHPSALPSRTLVEEPVDYVCDGEGPITVQQLIECLNGDVVAMYEIPGLVWRDPDNRIIHNPPAPLISIDELGGDIWDMLPMHLYRAHNWQCFDGSPRMPYASIYTSLGCPFKCSFCMINVFQHESRYRMRDPAAVVEQIALLHDAFDVRTFKIADEMFILNDAHVRAICEGLAAKPWVDEINIWAYARVDTIHRPQLAMLRRAGIRWLCLGIESGSSHVRDGSNKIFADHDIEKVVTDIQDAGIYVIGNYIFGLPDDTPERMQGTLDLALELNCEFTNFYSAMAYPGSSLYTAAIADGIALPEKWHQFSQHAYDTFPLSNGHCSSADILEFRDRAWYTYYTASSYLDMVREKFGQDVVDHIGRMANVPFTRKLIEEKRTT